jgi:hypothetical protein
MVAQWIAFSCASRPWSFKGQDFASWASQQAGISADHAGDKEPILLWFTRRTHVCGFLNAQEYCNGELHIDLSMVGDGRILGLLGLHFQTPFVYISAWCTLRLW